MFVINKSILGLGDYHFLFLGHINCLFNMFPVISQGIIVYLITCIFGSVLSHFLKIKTFAIALSLGPVLIFC